MKWRMVYAIVFNLQHQRDSCTCLVGCWKAGISLPQQCSVRKGSGHRISCLRRTTPRSGRCWNQRVARRDVRKCRAYGIAGSGGPRSLWHSPPPGLSPTHPTRVSALAREPSVPRRCAPVACTHASACEHRAGGGVCPVPGERRGGEHYRRGALY